MKASHVESLLRAALPHDVIQVDTRDEVHFEALIVSAIFEGESRLSRQRKVYAILGSFIESGELHALALKTLTPEEWQQKELT